MASKKKLLQAAAGSAGGAGLDVDEVFSTYLYDGDSQDNRNIVNNIDLSGEGGLVWTKRRDATANHFLIDTERGTNKYILSNSTNAENSSYTNIVSSFNNNGYEIGSSSFVNNSAGEYVSWTFRKAPKFFDVVTYTGTGSAQNISHNLGSKPNFYVVKQTSGSGGSWYGYHAGLDSIYTNPSGIRLDSTSAAFEANSSLWNLTFPTSTTFTVGTSTGVNASGETYVAYLFAHNNGDGEFGPDADQDVIKCGSYTGNGSGQDINLGFEAQWVMIKPTSTTGNWTIMDVMRSMPTSGIEGRRLQANTSNAEGTANYLYGMKALATGFTIDGLTANDYNKNGETYIYMAIRRGPLAEPESATDVFEIDNGNSSDSDPTFISNFPVDMAIRKLTTGSSGFISSRLTWQLLNTDNTNAEGTGSTLAFDNMDGYEDFAAASTQYSWMWKRAPSYFDAVAYTGNGTAGRTVSHNLGVAPEMMWVKRRDSAGEWMVYHSGIDATAPEDYYVRLSESGARSDSTIGWNDTAPTASVFSLGSHNWVNGSSNTYIAFLFASLAGVSKVGSYTGNGTSQTIDCGFSAGARFVLLKRTDSAGQWQVYDTERGIVSGDDPTITLNLTNAELTTQDDVDPDNSGFIVNDDGNNTNTSGASYIFYAIA